MAGESNRRDPIKNTVGNAAVQRRRQHAVSVAKERREAMFRTKRLCREEIRSETDVAADDDMMVEAEPSVLEAQTASAVEELKLAISFKGEGVVQKRVLALRELRRLLSRPEFSPVETALKSGAIPLLAQCLSFGSEDEQLLEAAWCLTNIAAGNQEATKALLPTLPLLIAHLGDTKYAVNESVMKDSLSVGEQCAWALGNVAGEGEEWRDLLLSQGILPPLARMMLRDKDTAIRVAAWTLSNLIKGPDPEAATELVKIDGVVDAILRHLKKSYLTRVRLQLNSYQVKASVSNAGLTRGFPVFRKHDLLLAVIDFFPVRGKDVDLATEVAWIVVYVLSVSDDATSVLMETDLVQVLVDRLAASTTFESQIPLLRSLGNLMADDVYTTNVVLVPGHEITDSCIRSLSKCLKSEHRFLKKEATWVLSNIAAGSVAHKQLICKSEAVFLLLELLATAPFDIKREVAYVLGNLCVAPDDDGSGRPNVLLDHLVSFVRNGCLPGFIDLVRSADLNAARLGLHFIELVLEEMPNGEGPKLVEEADGIEAMERFQFHENEELRVMSNLLVDSYFGEAYGLELGLDD